MISTTAGSDAVGSEHKGLGLGLGEGSGEGSGEGALLNSCFSIACSMPVALLVAFRFCHRASAAAFAFSLRSLAWTTYP